MQTGPTDQDGAANLTFFKSQLLLVVKITYISPCYYVIPSRSSPLFACLSSSHSAFSHNAGMVGFWNRSGSLELGVKPGVYQGGLGTGIGTGGRMDLELGFRGGGGEGGW